VITCKKLAAHDRAAISQKHGFPLSSSGRRKIIVPRCSIIVRAVVPMGIAGELQSIGQIRSKVP
jgi:hypothetical protein